MTNRELYRQYLQQLQQLYTAGEAAIITGLVFEKTAGLKRADIIKNPEEMVSDEIRINLDTKLTALLKYTPVQYVLGEAWFYKMKLKVSEVTLIPRPETEELVQLVIDDYISGKKDQQTNALINNDNKVSLLDIGTGSGCIAISLKKNLPEILMYAIDFSEGALQVASENAKTLNTAIEFYLVDFLSETNWQLLPVFDTIVSNPPYIPAKEKERLDKNVAAHEPGSALFVPDDNPYLFYEKIAKFGKTHLKDGGKIFVEIHENSGEETAEVFSPDYKVSIHNDLFGKERMLIIQKA